MTGFKRRQFILGAGGVVALGAAGAYVLGAPPDSYDSLVEDLYAPATPVSGEAAHIQRRLVHYASLAANGHNTQPWLFELQDGKITILPDFARRTPVVDPDDHHLYASLGCAAENLSIAARAAGLEPLVSFHRNGPSVILDKAPSIQSSPRFNAIPKRQSVRVDYDGKALSTYELKALEAAGTTDEVDLIMFTDSKDTERFLELIVEGNTSQMADPEFIRELKQWIRFNKRHAARTRDGLFTGASDNPTLPGWLGGMFFESGFKTEAENEKYAGHVRSSAGLAVFTAKKNTPEGWFAAGRACQRFALEAAARDIKYAFLNQPVEVAELRTDVAGLVGLSGRRPNLIVRFGHGPDIPRSLRRSVSQVLA